MNCNREWQCMQKVAPHGLLVELGSELAKKLLPFGEYK